MLSIINYNSSGQSHFGRRSCMLIAFVTCLLALRSTCLCQQVGNGPSSNDGLEYQSNGTILLSANGSWPEEQILERLRREYGWVTDYEQTPRLANMVVTRADGSLQAKMHSVSVSIPRPTEDSSAEELRVLGALASGLSSADERVTVVQNGGGGRFDILLSAGGAETILSTAIVIPSQARSVGDTITAVLEAVSTRTGQPILLGGIANSSLEITQVTVGGTQPLPARVLLAEALDALPVRHVWLLGYEPQMGSYTIGVEPAVRVTRTALGQVVEIPVKAPPKQK